MKTTITTNQLIDFIKEEINVAKFNPNIALACRNMCLGAISLFEFALDYEVDTEEMNNIYHLWEDKNGCLEQFNEIINKRA